MSASAQLDDDYGPGKLVARFDAYAEALVTHKYLTEVIEAVMDGSRAASLKRDAEIAALRGEIAALKQAWPEYRGVWAPGTYQKNWTVTRDGSLWIAKQTTTARPGDGADWQLCCKRGADGKDAKK